MIFFNGYLLTFLALEPLPPQLSSEFIKLQDLGKAQASEKVQVETNEIVQTFDFKMFRVTTFDFLSDSGAYLSLSTIPW